MRRLLKVSSSTLSELSVHRYHRGFYVREEIYEPHHSRHGAVPDESIFRFRVSGYATGLTAVVKAPLYFDVKLYIGLF